MLESRRSTAYDGFSRMLFKTVCLNCKVELWLPKHLLDKPRACSHRCRKLASQSSVLVACAKCGKQIRRRPSQIARSKTGLQFCSQACHNQAQTLEFGIQAVHLPHYTNYDTSRSYRRKALAHYGKTCQRCGYDAVEKMLDAHHRDGNRQNNKVTNLEVLCVWCHALDTRGVSPQAWNGKIQPGVVALTGERLHGVQKVRGANPLDSIN